MVKTSVFIIMGFCKLLPPMLLGEKDSILVEKWEEQIEEHLNALDVQNGVTCVGLVISQFWDGAEA